LLSASDTPTRTRRVAPFVIATFTFSWTIWIGLLVARRAGVLSTDQLGSLYGFGGLGPSLVALVLVWSSEGLRGARAFLVRVFEWRAPVFWYAYALLLPVLLRMAALGVYRLTGGVLLANPIAPLKIFIAYVVALIVPLMEEYGWRGYLQPALQSRFSAARTGLTVGVIWALWHAPLFWIPGTGFYNWAAASGFGIAFAGYAVSVVALALIISVQFECTSGNLLLVFLLHDAVNTSSDVLMAPYSRAGLTAPTWWAALILVVAGIAAFRWLSRPARGQEE
jgi:membrane protease YdiL (CAAX protease family)